MIPIRELEDYDRELIEKIDELTRRFYGINDKEVRVGFVGGMFHADRPLKDKDIIICVPTLTAVCDFAKELYHLGFDSVEIPVDSSYEEGEDDGIWVLIRLYLNGIEYQVQVRKLPNIFERIREFPLSIQMKAAVMADGVCVFWQDKDALILENVDVCYVRTTGQYQQALDKYKEYYPNMQFLIDTYNK